MVQIKFSGAEVSVKPDQIHLNVIGSPYSNTIGQLVVPMQYLLGIQLSTGKIFQITGNIEAPIRVLAWLDDPGSHIAEVQALLIEATGFTGLNIAEISQEAA